MYLYKKCQIHLEIMCGICFITCFHLIDVTFVFIFSYMIFLFNYRDTCLQLCVSFILLLTDDIYTLSLVPSHPMFYIQGIHSIVKSPTKLLLHFYYLSLHHLVIHNLRASKQTRSYKHVSIKAYIRSHIHYYN